MSAASALLVATIAFAEPSGQSRGTKVGPQTDPNQVVCVTERETGTRVGSRRVCRTRAEWAAHRADLRAATDRVTKGTFCTDNC